MEKQINLKKKMKNDQISVKFMYLLLIIDATYKLDIVLVFN